MKKPWLENDYLITDSHTSRGCYIQTCYSISRHTLLELITKHPGLDHRATKFSRGTSVPVRCGVVWAICFINFNKTLNTTGEHYLTELASFLMVLHCRCYCACIPFHSVEKAWESIAIYSYLLSRYIWPQDQRNWWSFEGNPYLQTFAKLLAIL